MTMNRALALIACGLGAICVLLGAFAAHGAGPQVKTLLTTGAHYGLVHALLALVASLMAARNVLIRWAGWSALLGGAVFAVSLSLIGLAGIPAMGAIAPIGGLLMILGWVLFALGAFRQGSSARRLS